MVSRCVFDPVVQIAAAQPGWWAVYKRDDGREITSRIELWGLTEAGHVVALDADQHGHFVAAQDAENFVRLERHPG